MLTKQAMENARVLLGMSIRHALDAHRIFRGFIGVKLIGKPFLWSRPFQASSTPAPSSLCADHDDPTGNSADLEKRGEAE
jgi:hypothetical protein